MEHRFILIGGPNGSGKTTLVASQLPSDIPPINADEIAKTLGHRSAQAANAEARQMASEMIEHHLEKRQSFALETTLDLKRDLALLREAKANGFQTEVQLIWSGGLDVSIARVQIRVAMGGHDVPIEEIRRRYEAAMEALAPIVAAADVAEVWDNAEPSEDGPDIVLQLMGGVITYVAGDPPEWLALAFERHLAPLVVGSQLSGLAANYRVYRAEKILERRRGG